MFVYFSYYNFVALFTSSFKIYFWFPSIGSLWIFIFMFIACVLMVAGKKWQHEGSRFRASDSTFCCKDGV